jgi:hypothetical protein
MAKIKTSAADDVKPAEGFTPAAVFGEEPSAVDLMHDIGRTIGAAKTLPPVPETDPRDAEIARLKEQLAAYQEAAPLVAGGRFTLSWKDGPTVTIEVLPGERPEDALINRYGLNSNPPHKINCQPAAADAPIGAHRPNGSVRPFGGPPKE